jgi:hypothetical protein
MLWASGYVDELSDPDFNCDVKKFVSIITDSKSQDLSEILDEADLIYRLH